MSFEMQSFFKIDGQIVPIHIVDFDHLQMKVDWAQTQYATGTSLWGNIHHFGIIRMLAIQTNVRLFLGVTYPDRSIQHLQMFWNCWDHFINYYCEFVPDEYKAFDWKEEGF